eukprot:TRINITY_DN16808_c0_g1_i1.p1 TRINITY_DN16808_c0_g1~~TRINITY_DN16808_c0_g1_i1.p1  ORF type:complete len:139 (+),score=44.45 TRINITY_DN16808_c0_g1_i1:389-805(+)
MSSILTNSRAIGQAWSPGFLITNAFGGVLDAKHAAETRLRTSGLDYVIVRPAGLRNTDPAGPLAFSPADTLLSGTVTRGNVAQVLAVAALSPAPRLDQVVEVVELGTCYPNTCPKDLAPAPQCLSAWFTAESRACPAD